MSTATNALHASLWALMSTTVGAAGPARIVSDPPPLAAAASSRVGGGAAATSGARELVLDLNVQYTDGRIWNPATQRFDAVRLRSYQGRTMDPAAPFVSPMLEVRPGDTVRMKLHNKLPADPSCLSSGGDINQPHCFNGTNLHTHGLWINPAGNGDNVLIAINPGVSFEYEYNLPPDHPAGTYWFHTHLHGSTALQVSSGMAGALIVRGQRKPGARRNGDLDTLLQPTPAQPLRERVLVMQQIQYACRDAQNQIKTNADGSYRCDVGDVGGIEGYDQFGPGTWPKSGRYTSINGHALPTFGGARTGVIERWRVIHGGVRDTINLEFRKLAGAAPSPQALAAAAHDGFVGQHCSGDPLPLHLVAADGLTLGAVARSLQATFQPAYRWDALMVFPETGVYCVIDAAAPAAANVDQAAPSHQLLGLVEVAAGRPVPNTVTPWLAKELAALAAVHMPADVRAAVVADLRNGLKLSRFIQHADVADAEVTGQQSLLFNIDVKQTPAKFQVDGKSFDPDRIDRVLRLGSVDEWTLKSAFVSHPFHIHVNPFQVVKILDPNGKDVSAPDAVDDAGGSVDLQYRGLKGVWKDTLMVKNIANPAGAPGGEYTVIVRTRYQRYIGDFVLHCHILDHEDQGMMQIVRVALPDGSGGTSRGHRH